MIFGLKQFIQTVTTGSWVAVNPQSQKYKLTNDDGTNFSKGYTTINLNNEDEIKNTSRDTLYNQNDWFAN